jgi:hypothetical protein
MPLIRLPAPLRTRGQGYGEGHSPGLKRPAATVSEG